MPNKYILVINAGSATLKFKVFELETLRLFKSGIVERIGLINSFILLDEQKEIYEVENHDEAFKLVVSKLAEIKNEIIVVGHRIVHGGEEFTRPTLITKAVSQRLKKYDQLAPLHNPVSMRCVAASFKYLKNAKNVGVFDTAFYRTLPEYAYLYALPMKYYRQYGIRRYGFHGISHQYMAEQASQEMNKSLGQLNLITCHLGSGCSITAIKKGQAVDTSMGFTPLEGLVMSTRTGSIDPAIPLFLIRKCQMSEEQVNDLLNKHSGIFGLSGTLDMRELLVKAGYKVAGFTFKGRVSAKEGQLARLTLEIFVYNIKKYIGAYSAILGQVDALVFSGGIGERSQIIRQLITKDLPKLKTLIIPANEELMIVQEAKKLITNL